MDRTTLIGQKKLLDKLESYTMQNVPKTLLFLGQNGCGKTWFAMHFAEQLGLEYVHVPKDIDHWQLVEYSRCPIEKMYIIDLRQFNEKDQNKLLKFIEEPAKTTYIVLLAESEIGILPTILNRCVKLRFESYSIDELKQLSWVIKCTNDLMYNIFKTPGQLLNLTEENFRDCVDLCDKILNKFKQATYANVIKISTKINLDKNPEKIDFDNFFKVLTYMSFEKYKETNDEFSFKLYTYLVKKQAERINKIVHKESYILGFLNDLWSLAH